MGAYRVWVGVVIVSALVATACGDESDSSPGADEPAPVSAAGPAAADALSVSIDEPADDADVAAEFTVRMTPSVDVGEPDTGLHHLHLYYDGRTAEGEFDMVFGDTATVTGLSPGEHLIEAVVVNPDHSPTDARAQITVNVTEGGSGGTGTPTTFPGYGGY